MARRVLRTSKALAALARRAVADDRPARSVGRRDRDATDATDATTDRTCHVTDTARVDVDSTGGGKDIHCRLTASVTDAFRVPSCRVFEADALRRAEVLERNCRRGPPFEPVVHEGKHVCSFAAPSGIDTEAALETVGKYGQYEQMRLGTMEAGAFERRQARRRRRAREAFDGRKTRARRRRSFAYDPVTNGSFEALARLVSVARAPSTPGPSPRTSRVRAPFYHPPRRIHRAARDVRRAGGNSPTKTRRAGFRFRGTSARPPGRRRCTPRARARRARSASPPGAREKARERLRKVRETGTTRVPFLKSPRANRR